MSCDRGLCASYDGCLRVEANRFDESFGEAPFPKVATPPWRQKTEELHWIAACASPMIVACAAEHVPLPLPEDFLREGLANDYDESCWRCKALDKPGQKCWKCSMPPQKRYVKHDMQAADQYVCIGLLLARLL